jgi:hypothetical protein
MQKTRGQIGLIFLFMLLGYRVAKAETCLISGPRYSLIADTVHWSVKIESGHNCVGGIRFGNVEFDSMKLVSPPQSGQVALQGPGFTYTAKTDFGGQDSFTIEVLGAIGKRRGSSTIHVTVSVARGAPSGPAAPRSVDGPPASAAKPRNRQ